MKFIPFAISLFFTVALIVALNRQWGSIPPIGKFISPQHGFWQNAEASDKDFNAQLRFPELKGNAQVYFDERLVPHVFAEEENDLYFIQGYLHAKFRLWQMEFQTFAAAGRLSEILGEKVGGNSILDRVDRQFRRLGMVYGAKKAVEEAEKNEISKQACDAYTAGVNAYINSLSAAELPVEYKLLNYVPEPWTNLKTALFLKYMSYDLAGSENDFEYTNARAVFGLADFEKMFPVSQDSLDPIIPKSTVFPKSATDLVLPSTADSLYFQTKDTTHISANKPDKDNGSNNWAVSGKKTKSGAPILCNDPHLGLNMPSLWFEMQLSSPAFNAYGASFPGSPGIIIGFNDSCAFGFTNAMRDVRDYYEIKFKDESMKEYWFNGEWKPSEIHYDTFKIKGRADYIDTVAYTVFGPVMYDKHFNGGRATNGKYYAVRWKAHDPSNELMIFNRLDHAKNYQDYLAAIKWLHTPGQNCLFAAKNGDIALWDQGEFPAKWKRQGDFVMPGEDSSYFWRGNIPQEENPHQYNPVRGFVSSANQLPVDPAAYPYYLGGSYPPYRGITINRKLNAMSNITAEDMKALQTSNYNVFAEMARPVLLKNVNESLLDDDSKKYLDTLRSWDLNNSPNSKGATIFVTVWENFEHIVWDDEMKKAGNTSTYPTESALLEGILKDSAFKFLDNLETDQKESLRDDVTEAFKRALVVIKQEDIAGRLAWGTYKDTEIRHLSRLEAFSRRHLTIGGGTNCINAAKQNHGPSWRMIVELTPETKAYGVYPGGQSGNPGSQYYETFVDNWVAGIYYPLWVMKKEDQKNSRVKWTMRFASTKE